jgi:hypothetical protein
MRSGSMTEVIERLNSLIPENPDNTTTRTAVTITIRKMETAVIIFTALVLLFENK